MPAQQQTRKDKGKMQTSIAQQIGGDYCVIVRTNGTSEIRKLKDVSSVFDEAKGFIGCKWLDHARVQKIAPDVTLEFLLNDEGYIQWGSDPSKVNQIGTYFYNGGQKPGHYILGDIVMCLGVDTYEGGDFRGMSEAFAAKIALQNNQKVIAIAKEKCPIPDTIPDPVVKVSSYQSVEDMMKAMKGDTSIKPTSETIISGGKKDAEAEA